jgi:uncharacterized damage-inducible protein DinB
MTEIARIVDQLDREYAGEPWHGSPLMAILDGLRAEQAAAKPLPGAHSIWELVLHITAWKGEVRRRLSGAPAGEPEDGDWPAVGEPTAARWKEALARLRAAHEQLTAAVRQLPPDRLFMPTNDSRESEVGAGVTCYELLHGIVQHDVYHSGQIAILKKGLR